MRRGLAAPATAAFLAIAVLPPAGPPTAAPLAAQEPTPEPEVPVVPGLEDMREVTLEEAVEIARRRNPSLEQARAIVDQREFDRLSAYGSFLPRLDMSYGYSNSSTGRLDPTGQSITNTSYSMQLGTSYDLFTGFRRFNDLRSARLDVRAEEARFRQSEFQTLLIVKEAFFNAVANRELVRVERDRVARQEDQLEFVRQQVQLGRATRSDLLRSQVDLNNARLAVLNAENAARTSSFRLSEALGVDEPVTPAEEARLEVEPLPLGREELVATALRLGPAVTSAEAAVEAAEAAIAAARSSYLPTLSFSGGYAWSNERFPPSNRSWRLSLQGSYPLFNGFQRETQLWRAQTQAEVAGAQERAARLALQADVDAAFSTLRSALGGIDLAEQTVELSREDLRVTQERYRLGLATILDLQSSQITLEQAEVDLINRRFDYQIGLAQLESLLGRSLREDGAADLP